MTEQLLDLYNQLKTFKENLLKLNRSRRTKKILDEKLEEASLIYVEYVKCSSLIEDNIEKGQIKSADIVKIKEINSNIDKLFQRIEEFCKDYNIETESNMEKFCIKTAVGLLPEMTGDEEVTKKLIDSLDLYRTMIDKTTEPQLVSFVLKTRLNEAAKLRLSETYATCDALIKDMRSHLLTKKSSNAIHSQLMRATQASSTVEEYGKQIEELFTSLTIAQADGEAKSYEVLKPINEKLAIKRFADGLRNRQLSVILTARNYTSLKDVISAAKDEEVSTTLRDGEGTIYTGHRGRPSRPNNGRVFTGRGRNVGQQRGSYHSYYGPRQGNNAQQHRGNYNQRVGLRGGRPTYGRGFSRGGSTINRGRYNGNNFNRSSYPRQNHRMYYGNVFEGTSTSSYNDSNTHNPEKFFRT